MEPLDLQSPEWSKLQDAYGSAEKIPALLQSLTPASTSENRNEPWFSLWSALAHQGDVYSASFAAVPHIVHILESDDQADDAFLLFPTWIEICRNRNNVEVPATLKPAYDNAVRKLPSLACKSTRAWENGFAQYALAAIAVGKGQWELGEALFELSPNVLPEFKAWLESH